MATKTGSAVTAVSFHLGINGEIYEVDIDRFGDHSGYYGDYRPTKTSLRRLLRALAARVPASTEPEKV